MLLNLCSLVVILCTFYCCKANKNPFGDDKPKPASIDSHKGIVALDLFTFPKIVPSSSQNVVVFVYQKAQVGDYGTDSFRHDYFTFADKANVDAAFDAVLFAQVVVNGAFNVGLAKSFGLEADFVTPALFLFPRGSSFPIRYPVDQPYNIKSLSRFVSKHLNGSEYVGLVKSLEEAVAQFYSSSDKAAVVAAVETVIPDLSSSTDKESAAYYVKVMNKILGEEAAGSGGYVDSELTRLEKTLQDGTNKMSEKSRQGLAARVNVLKLFRSKRDEKKTSKTSASPDL